MSAACSFGVKGVDGAAFEGGKGILDKAALVQGVGVDHHLHVHGIGDTKAAINRAGGGAPILMQLQRRHACAHLFDQRVGQAGVALAGKGQIHRQGVGGLHHAAQMPWPWRAGGGQRAMRRPGAAAQHGGDARVQRVFHLLGADEMDMGIHAARGQDAPLARDDLGSGANDDGDTGLGVGIARLADGCDQPVAQADIGLVDAGMVDDQRVGDDRIHRPTGAADLALAHAIADHLAAAELDLFAVGGQVTLDLDDQIGVAQPQPVTRGGAIHAGIGLTIDAECHVKAPP